MVSIWKRSALLILSCSLTSGCVTMMRGTSEEIKIFTDPGGARATLSDGQSCDTPCTLTTKRRDDLTVVVQKAGCQSATAKMTAVMDSTGVLVGGIVDLANGAVYVHQPNPLSVQLACGPPADSPQAAPQLSTATTNANAAPAPRPGPQRARRAMAILPRRAAHNAGAAGGPRSTWAATRSMWGPATRPTPATFSHTTRSASCSRWVHRSVSRKRRRTR